MHRLDPPLVDELATLSEIIGSKRPKRRLRLRKLAAKVERRYSALSTRGPFRVEPVDLGHGHLARVKCKKPNCPFDDLRHLWMSPTKALDQLKHTLAQHHRTKSPSLRCPYCGIGESNTWDHYLPKESYPEFSIAATNLLPSCGYCNSLKKSLCPTGRDRFLHPFLDPLDDALLTCEITFRSGCSPSIHFRPLSGTGLEQQTEFHFSELKLAERMVGAAAELYESFVYELQENGMSIDCPDAQVLAARRAKADRRSYGSNRFSTVLFAALADLLPLADS